MDGAKYLNLIYLGFIRAYADEAKSKPRLSHGTDGAQCWNLIYLGFIRAYAIEARMEPIKEIYRFKPSTGT